MRSALVRLWAAPWSLLGLLFSPLFGSRRRRSGILLCEGARWGQTKSLPFSAITFGHVVLSVPDEISEPVLEHELAHVAQYERWGPLFIPAYLLGSAWVLTRGRHYYRDNPFEISARRSVCTQLPFSARSD